MASHKVTMTETLPPVFTNFTTTGLVKLPERIFRINEEQILKITVEVCPTHPTILQNANENDLKKIVQRYFVVLHPKSQTPVVVIPHKVQSNGTTPVPEASVKDVRKDGPKAFLLSKPNERVKNGIFVEEVNENKQSAIVIRRAPFAVRPAPETVDLDQDSDDLEQSDVLDDEDDEPCLAPIVERLVQKAHLPATVTPVNQQDEDEPAKSIGKAAPNKQNEVTTPTEGLSTPTDPSPYKKRQTDQAPTTNVQPQTQPPDKVSASRSNLSSKEVGKRPQNPSLYQIPNDLTKTIEMHSEVLIKQEHPDTDPLGLESTSLVPAQRLVSKEILVNLPPEKLYPLPQCSLQNPLVLNWGNLTANHQVLLQGLQFTPQSVPQQTSRKPALNLKLPVPEMPILPQLPQHPVQVSAWDTLDVDKPPDDLVSKLIKDAALPGSGKPTPQPRQYSLEMRTAILTTYIENYRDAEKTIAIIKEKYPEMRNRKLNYGTLKNLYYKFKSKKTLENQHAISARKVHPLKERKCRFCGRDFDSENRLKAHEMVHTGEKPFSCDKCDYKCRKNSLLTKHLLLFHKIALPKQRPNKKAEPSTSFSADGDPSCKKEPENDLPSFVCEVCGKSFLTKTHLREHSRTHTDERPYLCTICGRALRNNSCLRHHMMGVHKITFNCDICGKVHGSKVGLRWHRRDVHGEQV